MAGEVRVGTVAVGVIPDARGFVSEMRAQLMPATREIGREMGATMSTEIAGGMNMGQSVSRSVRSSERDVRAASREMGTMMSSEVAGSMNMGQNVAKSVQKEEGAIKAAGARAGTGFVEAMRAPFSAITGMIVPLLAIGGGVALFKGIIDQGNAAARSSKIVQQAISATGGAAHITAGQVQELAAAQSRATGVDRAAIQQSDALLLRFSNVRNEVGKGNDVFNRTSQAALDLTAALNKGQVTSEGLTQTTRVLGKALDDPAKGMATLRRYGVILTQQQQDQVKAFKASGDTLGAQKVILDAVNASYGGTAAKMATNGAKIKASIGEMEATIGQDLLPVIGLLIGDLAKVINAMSPMIDWFFKGSTTASIFRDVIVALVIAVASYVAIMKVKAAIDLLSGKYMIIMNAATKAYAATSVEAGTVTRVWAAAQMLLNGALDANPIGIVVIAIAALVLGLYEAYKHSEAFRNIVNQAWGVVRTVAIPAGNALKVVLTVLVAAVKLLASSWILQFNIISSGTRAAVSGMTAVFNGLIHLIRDLVPGAFRAGVSAVTGALNGLVSAVARPVDAITSKLSSIGNVFNKITGAIGIAAKIPGLAGGGRIVAGTGPTADDVLIRVSRGETVVSAAQSQVLAPYFHAVGVPGYATGGVVGAKVAHAAEGAVNAVKSATGAVAAGIGDVANQVINVAGKAIDIGKITMGIFTGNDAEVKNAFSHLVGDHHPGVAVGSVLDNIFVQTPIKAVEHVTKWLMDNGGMANGSTILQYAMTFANKVPYVWGGAQPSGWDCSGFVSWIYQHYNLLASRMVADALQNWGKATPGPVPGGMVFFGKPAHHVGFAMDNSKYLSALGTQWGTIVSSVAGNSGFAIPPTGFDKVNGAGAGSGAPGTWANSGGVARWASTVMGALALLHLSPSLAPQIMHQIQTESGGNPAAINNWDVNAAHGDPSKGLLQVIGGTFAAYHVPGTSFNIYDPLANIAAAVNYALHRYGPSLMSGSMGLGSGHGYDSGGWLPPGVTLAYNGTGRPEPVLTNEQWNAIQGGAGGGSHYHAHFDGMTSQVLQSEVRTAFRAMDIQQGNVQRIGRRR